MLMAMPWLASRLVNAAPVNCEPWSPITVTVHLTWLKPLRQKAFYNHRASCEQ